MQLKKAQKHIIVIDDEYRIIEEYRHKTSPNTPKGPGDVFLKWLLQNLRNESHVEVVKITELSENIFEEFPDSELQDKFDSSDRKFIAVSHAHPDKPPILQATDCKWLDWWKILSNYEIQIRFLCPEDVCRFYTRKFPNGELPPLPGE